MTALTAECSRFGTSRLPAILHNHSLCAWSDVGCKIDDPRNLGLPKEVHGDGEI